MAALRKPMLLSAMLSAEEAGGGISVSGSNGDINGGGGTIEAYTGSSVDGIGDSIGSPRSTLSSLTDPKPD